MGVVLAVLVGCGASLAGARNPRKAVLDRVKPCVAAGRMAEAKPISAFFHPKRQALEALAPYRPRPGQENVVDAATMLERCVAHVLQLPQLPDAVLFTGDLVDRGHPDEYRVLRDLIQPLLDALPVYLMPGNHDDRESLRQSFAEHTYLWQWAPFVQYVIEDHPLRLVALDTLMPRAGHGELCEQRLRWLDDTQDAQPSRPTVVALHHPPFVTGIGHMDRLSLSGRKGLAEVISRHPQVERVLAGHLHRPITVRFGGNGGQHLPEPGASGCTGSGRRCSRQLCDGTPGLPAALVEWPDPDLAHRLCGRV